MVEEDLKRKKIKLLIIAKDSSEKTKIKFIKIADQFNIPYIISGEIESISKAIGKNNKALIGVRDKNFASEIEKKYNGGDIIG